MLQHSAVIRDSHLIVAAVTTVRGTQDPKLTSMLQLAVLQQSKHWFSPILTLKPIGSFSLRMGR